MSESQQLLFVYGTLRTAVRDPEYQMLDRHVEFVGMGSFQGKLYNLGPYPGAIPSPSEEDVLTGEVYLLEDPDHTLPITTTKDMGITGSSWMCDWTRMKG